MFGVGIAELRMIMLVGLFVFGLAPEYADLERAGPYRLIEERTSA